GVGRQRRPARGGRPLAGPADDEPAAERDPPLLLADRGCCPRRCGDSLRGRLPADGPDRAASRRAPDPFVIASVPGVALGATGGGGGVLVLARGRGGRRP